jgi:hypothetical protein
MADTCKATIRSGKWAGGTCDRDVVPGFEVCWFHANVEELGAKIVSLTQERDDAQSLGREWKKAWEAKEAVLVAEQQRRCDAETALADLQRSVASALFGAARDDERVPPERISGATVDALFAGNNAHHPRQKILLVNAEAFCARRSAVASERTWMRLYRGRRAHCVVGPRSGEVGTPRSTICGLMVLASDMGWDVARPSDKRCSRCVLQEAPR